VLGHDVEGGVEDLAAPTRSLLIDHSIQCTLTHVPLQRRALLVPLLLLIAAAAGWVWLQRPASGPLTASGTIEFDEVTLAAEAPGRLVELSVDEGSRVVEGQVIGRQTDPVLNVQNKQALIDPSQSQVTQAQMARLDVTAPVTGVVQKQVAHKGEYLASGAPILTVADPTDLKLTLYVAEADLARVSVGQQVEVRADGFGDRAFVGRVTSIANRAEFTPRNVQTARDRQNLVFAVTVRVPNPDSALKAGLPVDATFDQ
jgi:multidrug resistance efflux pump